MRLTGAILAVLVVTACGQPVAAPRMTSWADAHVVALAKNANITQADMGGAWVVHAPARDAEPVAGCTAHTPLADLPAGTRQLGAQLKVPNTKWFVYTSSVIFPDEMAAARWGLVRGSTEYVECRRGELEKEQKAADDRLFVQTDMTTGDGVGTNGYESFVRYQLKFDAGAGAQNARGTFDRHTYRLGRIVVVVNIDMAPSETDPEGLYDMVYGDVTRALTAVFARTGQ